MVLVRYNSVYSTIVLTQYMQICFQSKCYILHFQARSGLLATGPAGGLGVSHGGGQGDKSVCGVRAAPRKISQFKVLKRPYSVEETDQRDLALARGLRRREAPT